MKFHQSQDQWRLRLTFHLYTLFYEPSPKEITFTHDHGYSCQPFLSNEVANICLIHEKFTYNVDAHCREIKNLKTKIADLKAKVNDYGNNHMTIEKFKDDDDAITFYTGFPNYHAFMAAFEYMEPKFLTVTLLGRLFLLNISNLFYRKTATIKPGRKRKISLKNEFFLTLLRLKLVCYKQLIT